LTKLNAYFTGTSTDLKISDEILKYLKNDKFDDARTLPKELIELLSRDSLIMLSSSLF
jgi:hypothetical protein